MLSIVALAYAGKSAAEVQAAGTPTERRQRLFDAYTAAMFQRRSKQTDYTWQQTTSWLSWLAKQMVQHNQTVYYIERMQPAWLPLAQQRGYRIRVRLLSALLGALLGTLLGGLFIGLVFGPGGGLVIGLLIGLGGWLVPGLIGGSDGCYPYLSWIIHKPHSNAVKRLSHVRDAGHEQTCDFCAPTSFGLFVCFLTKRRFMPF